MTVDPNYTKSRDGDDRAWNVPSEARETFERVSSLQLEELLRTANGDEARGRAGRDGNGFAMPEDSDADGNSSDDSEVSDAGDEREDLEDVDDVERLAPNDARTIEVSGEDEADDDDDDDESVENEATGRGEPHEEDSNDYDHPEPFEDVEGEEEEERKTRARLVIIRLRDEMFASDPHFKKRTVAQLNAEAVDFLKKGDVFTDDQIDGYIELKQEEVTNFLQAPHPVEFEMYYSV